MKLACPECSQQFSVPDNAIGPKGRKLRCSKCSHEWHQTMGMLEENKAPKPAAPAPAPQTDAPKHDEEDVVPFARFGSGEANPEAQTTFENDDKEEDHEGVFGAPPIPRSRIPLSRPPKRRRKGIVAAGTALVMLVMFGILFGARGSLVAAWPPIDRLYSSMGLGVPVIGEALVIQNVAAWRKADGSIELLVIKGEIRNPTEQMQTVPTLAGKLTGSRGDIMQEWLFRAENQVMLPGEKTSFEYELPQPGADAAEVTITFSERALGGGLGY